MEEETGIVFIPMCLKCGNIIAETIKINKIPELIAESKSNKANKASRYKREGYEIQPSHCEKCGARFVEILARNMCDIFRSGV